VNTNGYSRGSDQNAISAQTKIRLPTIQQNLAIHSVILSAMMLSGFLQSWVEVRSPKAQQQHKIAP
jgi:hypothetical protein